MDKKYYILQLSSLQNIFSKIDTGNNINFQIQNSNESLNSIELIYEDEILVSLSDKVFYGLSVVGKNENQVLLHKKFEIEKSIDSATDKIGVFSEISLEQYKSICSKLFSDFTSTISNDAKEVDLGNLKEKFADWLINKNNKYGRVYKYDRNILIEKLTEFEKLYNIDFGILIFSFPNISIETIIDALETNIIEDSGEIGDLNRRTVGNGSVKAILGPNNYITFLKELLLKIKTSAAKSSKVDPVNKIYFGAPGTGKSYQITQDLKDVDLIFQKRVTFHPEYDNASFVGGYKPITDSNGKTKYEFVPQIFTNIYVEASNDPTHQYYLIIEEINRGNCAEIFGELFQLLDRNKDYEISPSKELIDYLNKKIPSSDFYKEEKMLLPDNLSILATMNTSDQSLFPMDSAFKRRWDWEYIPINYDKDSKNESAKYTIVVDATTKINWIDFISKINPIIELNPNLGMDKCIGNYFVKPKQNNEISLDEFIHKVMFYLWNDVFKDEPIESIFKNGISYQRFFPIEAKGLELVKSIFIDLGLIEPLVIETTPEA